MLHIDHLLCLVTDQTHWTVVEQALHLGGLLQATVHILSTDAETNARVNPQIQAFVDAHDVPDPITEASPRFSNTDCSPIDGLNEYIREHDIDLVVTGTPDDRGAVPVLATDDTQTLVKELECSIFVLNPDSDLQTAERIFVPTDFSQQAHTALDRAISVATLFDAEIDLLNVIETVPYVALTPVDRLSMSDVSFPERRARRQLGKFLNAAPETDIPIRSFFEFGDPADQINHFLNQHEADLMVLCVPPPHPSTNPLGPVSDRILRRIACPVFLIRHEATVP